MFSRESRDFILGLSLFCFAIAIGFNLSKSNEIETYKGELELLEKRVDSLNLINLGLEKRVTTYRDSIALYESEIADIKNSIKLIRKKADEKINFVPNLTFPELEEFFAKRYNSKATSSDSKAGSN